MTVVGSVRAGVSVFPVRPPPGTNHQYPTQDKRRCDDRHRGAARAETDGRAGRFHVREPGRSRPAEGQNDFSPLEEREGRNQTNTKPDLPKYAKREARQLTTPDCSQYSTVQPIRVDSGRTSHAIVLNDG